MILLHEGDRPKSSSVVIFINCPSNTIKIFNLFNTIINIAIT